MNFPVNNSAASWILQVAFESYFPHAFPKKGKLFLIFFSFFTLTHSENNSFKRLFQDLTKLTENFREFFLSAQ